MSMSIGIPRSLTLIRMITAIISTSITLAKRSQEAILISIPTRKWFIAMLTGLTHHTSTIIDFRWRS